MLYQTFSFLLSFWLAGKVGSSPTFLFLIHTWNCLHQRGKKQKKTKSKYVFRFYSWGFCKVLGCGHVLRTTELWPTSLKFALGSKKLRTNLAPAEHEPNFTLFMCGILMQIWEQMRTDESDSIRFKSFLISSVVILSMKSKRTYKKKICFVTDSKCIASTGTSTICLYNVENGHDELYCWRDATFSLSTIFTVLGFGGGGAAASPNSPLPSSSTPQVFSSSRRRRSQICRSLPFQRRSFLLGW